MNKKLLFLLVSFSFLNVFSQNLISDNFNSYTIGDLNSQGLWFGAFANEAKIAELTPSTYGKSMKFERMTPQSMWVYKDCSSQWLSRTSGNNILETKYSFYSGAGTGYTDLQLYGSSFYLIAGLGYRHDTRTMVYVNGLNTSMPSSVVSLLDNTWYNISLYYNYVSGSTTILVNGITYGPFAGAPNKNVEEVDFHTSGNAFTSAVDNLSMNAVNSILSTDEIFNRISNLKIYPNPTSDIVNISSNKKIAEVLVYDFSGKLIFESKESVLKIKELSPASYLIKIIYQDGSIESKNIIKK